MRDIMRVHLGEQLDLFFLKVYNISVQKDQC